MASAGQSATGSEEAGAAVVSAPGDPPIKGPGEAPGVLVEE